MGGTCVELSLNSQQLEPSGNFSSLTSFSPVLPSLSILRWHQLSHPACSILLRVASHRMLSRLVLPRVLSFAELCNMLAEAQPASANPEHPKIGQDDALRVTEWMMKAAHPGTKTPREETLSADQFA